MVIFKNIKKIYAGNVEAVKDFNLTIDDREFVVLVGPSGCGKSTLLRMTAGLESITDGELYIDDVLINDISPKDRDVAMVFQNYALYPHMNVYENMALGLKLRKVPKKEIDTKIKEASRTLHIEELLDRKPKALSGGEQQRVALGRAIVRKPKVFLMDEPLSNLDAKLRTQMRIEIIKLHRRMNSTFIYVTHDQTEAMTMGTRIVVMKDGVIQQVASPKELYDCPVNMFVAGFIGSPSMNFIGVKIFDEDDRIKLNLGNGEIILSAEASKHIKGKGYAGKELIMGIRPEHIDIKKKIEPFSVDCIVSALELMGAEVLIHGDVNDKTLVVKTSSENDIRLGEKISLVFNEKNLYFFDKETEKTMFGK